MAAAKRTFKSKRTVSSVMAQYKKWNEWKEGEFIIGEYIKSVEDKYGKPNWLIKIDEAGFTSKKDIAKFEGKIIGLNSSGGLDRAMEQVEVGEMVQITYEGMEQMNGGPYKGKDKHLHDVQVVVDEEDYNEDDDAAEEVDEEEEDDL